MRWILPFLMTTILFSSSSAQGNVGIGTASPYNSLEIHGNLVVTEQKSATTSAPTMDQTKTMIIGVTTHFLPEDSTGRFFDPGGPDDDYLANISSARIQINEGSEGSAIQLWFESMEIAEGDSLIIRAFSGGPVLMAVGNGYTATGTQIFHTHSLWIKFESDNDLNSTGEGFSILYRRLYPAMEQPQTINVAGNSFFYDCASGALQSGTQYLGTPAGQGALALGKGNTSWGNFSVAMGSNSHATQEGGIAMGMNNSVTGLNSVAMGLDNTITGNYTSVFGRLNSVTSSYAVAMGYSQNVSGPYATSIGTYNEVVGYGAHAIGSYCEAAGPWSVSSGYRSFTNGYNSQAHGFTLISNGYSGTVIGLYNDPVVDPEDNFTLNTPLFIIGNGVGGSDESRSNAMIVRYNGFVGIGTNTPRTKLHITNGQGADYSNDAGYVAIGSIGDLNLVIDNNEILARDNGSQSDLYLQQDGGKLFVGAYATPNFLFNVNGSAGKPSGGSWSALSDQRLKNGIQPYADGLKTLLQINPVRYHYTVASGYDPSPEYVGVIAQDLQKIAPYMVTSSEHTPADGLAYLTVDNSAMTYMLINAVKELHQENQELREKIEVLSTSVAQLSAGIR
jgi:hypothetical protein